MERCIEDMHDAVSRGRMTLEEQTRAYDILDYIMGEGHVDVDTRYCEEYDALKDRLPGVCLRLVSSESAGFTGISLE